MGTHMEKASNFKTSILVPYLDIEKVKFQTVVFWFICLLPWSQLLCFEINIIMLIETMITNSGS